MKKTSILLAVLIILVASVFFVSNSIAATYDVTLTWTQGFNDPNNPNADHFNVYRKPEGFGYSKMTEVPFTGTQPTYSITFTENFTDGEVTTYWYYQTMVNNLGIETSPSNEQFLSIDLTPDSPPVQLPPTFE